MKGKKIILSLAVFLGITIPVTVFAATSNTAPAKILRGFFGIDTTKLTDQQKSNITDYSKKMADLQKEFINSMVNNGTLTKEQGDAQTKIIDDAVKNGTYSPQVMGGKEGRPGGLGAFGIDESKLTAAQKVGITETNTKITELQNELIKKEVADGLITKAQGDGMTSRIDNSQNNGNPSYGMGRGGFGGLNLSGVDTSKLTVAQKTYITDYSKKFSELQKELINKYVSYGLMTKEQGAAVIQRIDNMGNDILNKGPNFNYGMGGRGFRGHGGHPDDNPGNGTPAAM
jgi:polyhydroxyalkanoate synthesis regulator phasin